MKLSEARRQARLQLSYGWYHETGTRAYVFCPVCRVKQTADVLAWWTPRQRCAELVVRLTGHLAVEHE